jgi:hypothetical protein
MAKNNQKNRKDNSYKTNKNNSEHKMKKSRNIWKVLAIAFVALFIIIIAAGMLRSHKFREPPVQLTDIQIKNAESIALSDMTLRGSLPANYTIRSPGVARVINADNIKRNVTEVSIYNSTSRIMYIIDVDTGKILVYTNTEFFDGLNHLNDGERINENMPPPRESGSPAPKGLFGK